MAITWIKMNIDIHSYTRFAVLFLGLLLSMVVCATEYIGTMQMASGYTLDDVRVSIDEKGCLTMYRVKFALLMPLRVDVMIPQVKQDGEKLSGDNIIPTVSNKPYPDKIVTKLNGTISSNSISFSCLFGGKGMEYKGQKKN
jgi:hypothetical protein